MNSMGSPSQMPMLNAAMNGVQQGQNASITPSSAQPQGAPGLRNKLCGDLKWMVDKLNYLGSLLNGEGLTEYANDLYKSSYQVNTVCEKLEKDVSGVSDRSKQ